MSETSLFPYEKFPIRLDIKSQNRVCWFECEHHLNKLIEREGLKPKDYELHTNNLEIVGKGTRRKGTQKGSRSRSSRNT
jgi:hypothetical protein